jgi:peptidoglycan/xylan/chitin deacetylase (PgdA/CDA1 family)
VLFVEPGKWRFDQILLSAFDRHDRMIFPGPLLTMPVNFPSTDPSDPTKSNFPMAKPTYKRFEIKQEQPAQPGRPWVPNAFMGFTFIFHTAALVAVLWRPDDWPWALSAVGLNQLILILAGLWPRSRLLGPNWTRLPPAAAARGEVSITIDDGPDPEITPLVLDVLDQFDAKASFFCIAEKARQYPELCREIVSRGHSIENHSWHHRLNFAFAGYRGFTRELTEAQDILTRLSGSRPLFFRAPFGIRNPILEPVLSRLGLQLASWTRRGFDTRETNPGRVSQRLLRGLQAGDILLLHDGNASRTLAGDVVILQVLPGVLAAIQKANLHAVNLRSARA